MSVADLEQRRTTSLARVCVALFVVSSAFPRSHQLAAHRASRAVVAVIPVLLVLFFAAGDRIDWTVMLVGLGWRAWLLLYALPYLAAGMAGPS